MTKKSYILALDQGTTSTRAIVFDDTGSQIITYQKELKQIFPQSDWVEHDPEEIWEATVEVLRRTLSDCVDLGKKVDTIGITNQRETTVLWDKKTGDPVYNAIVWQDQRTSIACENLSNSDNEKFISKKTGLTISPYFSASKISWILDNVDGVRKNAEDGRLAFGTIDSFLLWRLTGGKAHLTDATNASRTLLFNIHNQKWDEDLLSFWRIPKVILPEVRDSSSFFGITKSGLFDSQIKINSMVGDQQAAAIGQACVRNGTIKATYGTGCFLLMNTGDKPIISNKGLLTTLAYRINGKPTYSVEGSIFSAGSTIQWLRDGLKLISSASETEELAKSLSSNKGIYLVPAFTGLGAPYWNSTVRGTIFGLTLETGPAEIARASLEAVTYQSYDIIKAMESDLGQPIQSLQIDGGMTDNDWFVQYLSNILNIKVARPRVLETTALGAAFLAGLGSGLYSKLEDIENLWKIDRPFCPNIDHTKRLKYLAGWKQAVQKLTMYKPDNM
ncbi:MAG: glycerol kinase [Alphaproteobacteria bacterium]|nr:glycerol kinase [Alphaproteobacteria bacterium]PPR13840.1 MAG: Glycerol kinase [Alphaproteobacteria bacterium MarineAlpha12_Bin1]